MKLLRAVKLECQHTLEVCKAQVSSDGGGIHYGAMTPYITNRMTKGNMEPMSIRQCRDQLKKLERDGVLISRPTPGGLTRWWPVGFADDATFPKALRRDENES